MFGIRECLHGGDEVRYMVNKTTMGKVAKLFHTQAEAHMFFGRNFYRLKGKDKIHISSKVDFPELTCDHIFPVRPVVTCLRCGAIQNEQIVYQRKD